MDKCVFCKIIAGELSGFPIWENEEFVAILDRFPKIPGQVAIVTKEHQPSYIFKLPEDYMARFEAAAREVGLLMDKTLKCRRTTQLIEGLEVDHAHIKLFPVYSVTNYETHFHSRGEAATDKDLRELQTKFRKGVDL